MLELLLVIIKIVFRIWKNVVRGCNQLMDIDDLEVSIYVDNNYDVVIFLQIGDDFDNDVRD